MRKVIYLMLMSLDGYIEDENGGFGWAEPDEELHRHVNASESVVDTHLYGRRMYELMSGFWPTADEDPAAPEHIRDYAAIWRSKQKVVFSSTLAGVGPDARLVRGDPAEEVAALKAQPGKHMSVGGAALAGALMRAGLIDEYHLYLFPVMVGGGKSYFSPLNAQIPLRLEETRTFKSGVVLLRYAAV